MEIDNEILRAWFAARDIIATYLTAICPHRSHDQIEQDAAVIIARLAAHDLSILLEFKPKA